MIGPPQRDEAAPYYFTYIDRVASGDIIRVLEGQLGETLALLAGISEEKSKHRYEAGKWSFRQLLNHVNDVELLFLFRAFWFARGFDLPLPSFDEKSAAETSGADEISWSSHVAALRATRLASLAFFRNLPAQAWMQSGLASGNSFSVRSIAYIIAGHAAHHMAILKERYL